ncbi:MAG: hypothetical protein WCD70_01990, partial [Alphaproteobacteria bacterium]
CIVIAASSSPKELRISIASTRLTFTRRTRLSTGFLGLVFVTINQQPPQDILNDEKHGGLVRNKIFGDQPSRANKDYNASRHGSNY